MDPSTTVKKFEAPLVEKVLTKVNSLKEIGGIALPPDFSAENALRSAWLILQDMKLEANLPVLQSSTPDSIANSLFNMVVQGLNPAKHQCSFILYGNKLTLQREICRKHCPGPQVQFHEEYLCRCDLQGGCV